MISDGISYLDLGDSYLRADWSNAANAYWSPMYPWLLGISMKLVKPSLWWQFPLVHVVNFVVFLWALFCFRYFVRSLLADQQFEQSRLTVLRVFHLPQWVLWAIAYALFLWSSLVLIGIWIVTPDLLLSSWIYLAAGLLVRLRSQNSYPKFLMLGVVLGAAYLSKGVMFPLAFALLTIALFSGNSVISRIPLVVSAAVAFLVIASPLIVLLSHAKGRLTYGDSGKLAYAWLVSPGFHQINGQSGSLGVLVHPTRKILEHPPVYEFAQPIGGSFPPWYDPSYWNDGLRPRFNLRSQVRALVANLSTYLRLLAAQSGWLAGVLTFALIGRSATIRGIARNWPLIIFSMAALGLYAFVFAIPRYAAAFLLVLCLSVAAGIRLPELNGRDQFVKCVAIATVATMMFSVTQPLLEMAYQGLLFGGTWGRQEPMRVAEGLQYLGLRTGDHVAIIGIGITDFWSRLGGFKIVAQIMPQDEGADEFWSSSRERKNIVYSSMAQSGALAVITRSPPTAFLDPSWQQIPGTYYYMHFLRRQSDVRTP